MPAVAGLQLDLAWEDPAANRAQAREMLAGMSGLAPGTLVVLPEMFATGFSMNVDAVAEAEPPETVLFFQELARERQVAVLGGLATRSGTFPGMGRNELRVVSPEGEQLARYQKNRTFRYTGEHAHYERGTEVVVFDWGGLRVCPLICYDLRFPELFRRGVAAGAEAFVVIASWPAAREEHWVALLRARAIENLAWVVGVNRSGRDPSWEYPGRSLAIDPQGAIVADAGRDPGILVADLDPEAARSWRKEFPALLDLEI